MPSLHSPNPSEQGITAGRVSDLAAEFSKLSAEFTKQSNRLLLLEQRFAELHLTVNRGAFRNDAMPADENLPSVLGASAFDGSASDEEKDEIRPPHRGIKGSHPERSSSLSSMVRQFLDHDGTQLTYHWEESLWDVSVWIGSKQMSIGASLAITWCLGLYMVLVFLYISECWFTFTESRFDQQSEHDFMLWRSSVAHDVNLRDVLTGESLASKVCHEKFSSPYSNFQLGVVQELREYLTPRRFFLVKYTAGGLMVSLALCLWCLTLTVEIRKILDLASAFVSLDYGWHSQFSKEPEQEGSCIITRVSYARLLYVVLTLALRVGIVIILGRVGNLFLLHTTDLQEMLLNSLALEYILNLDEMLFAALLPKRPRAFLERIEPIRYKQAFPWWNSHGQTVVFSFILGIVYSATTLLTLNPFVETLKHNLDALCGGREHGSYDFVVLVDSIGIPWVAATPSAESVAQEDVLGTYAQHVILRMQRSSIEKELHLSDSRLQPTQRNNSGAFMQVASGDDLMRLKVSSSNFGYPKDWSIVTQSQVEEILGYKLEIAAFAGADLGSVQGTVYNSYLRYLLGESFASCDQVPRHRCYRSGGRASDVVFRQLCPHHCGCDSPETGTAATPHGNTMLVGCSSINLRSKTFVEELRASSCEDTSSHAIFLKWVQGVGDARDPTQGGLMLTQLVAAFNTGGCSAAVQIHAEGPFYICERSSMAAICPQSCGCDPSTTWTLYQSAHVDYCPYSCTRALNEPCMTVKVDYHNITWEDGPHAGLPCIFPFNYKGEEYNKCTDEDWYGPWCSVVIGESRTAWMWGDCDPNC